MLEIISERSTLYWEIIPGGDCVYRLGLMELPTDETWADLFDGVDVRNGSAYVMRITKMRHGEAAETSYEIFTAKYPAGAIQQAVARANALRATTQEE